MSTFFLTSNSLLFNFTSYLVSSVIEEEESKVQDENGNDVVLPTNMAGPNPNDAEFDNLYLDMNGIVSPFISPLFSTDSLNVSRFIPALIRRAKSVRFRLTTGQFI